MLKDLDLGKSLFKERRLRRRVRGPYETTRDLNVCRLVLLMSVQGWLPDLLLDIVTRSLCILKNMIFQSALR